ncbi:MAG: hypothetical protein HYV63_12550 [Candidatus Schekmanbacteria bacterium]|nr:hypothetical protein [Candidatus Schekmanbacteria bacterium]
MIAVELFGHLLGTAASGLEVLAIGVSALAAGSLAWIFRRPLLDRLRRADALARPRQAAAWSGMVVALALGAGFELTPTSFEAAGAVVGPALRFGLRVLLAGTGGLVAFTLVLAPFGALARAPAAAAVPGPDHEILGLETAVARATAALAELERMRDKLLAGPVVAGDPALLAQQEEAVADVQRHLAATRQILDSAAALLIRKRCEQVVSGLLQRRPDALLAAVSRPAHPGAPRLQAIAIASKATRSFVSGLAAARSDVAAIAAPFSGNPYLGPDFSPGAQIADVDHLLARLEGTYGRMAAQLELVGAREEAAALASAAAAAAVAGSPAPGAQEHPEVLADVLCAVAEIDGELDRLLDSLGQDGPDVPRAHLLLSAATESRGPTAELTDLLEAYESLRHSNTAATTTARRGNPER